MVCGLESPQLMRGASGGRRSLVYQPRPTSRGGNMSIESQLIEPLRGPVTVFLRLALGIAFLSAVAPRVWPFGPPGTENVPRGGLPRFTHDTGPHHSWAPAAPTPPLPSLSPPAGPALRG